MDPRAKVYRSVSAVLCFLSTSFLLVLGSFDLLYIVSVIYL